MENEAVPPVRARWSDGLRDPWVVPGLVLLVLTTGLVLFLYAGQPQTAAEVGGRAWVAIAPDAYTPRISRARERVSAALAAAAAGDTAAALARYAEAEEQALDARGNAGTDAARLAESTEMWAGIALDRAGMMLASGASPWYRADDTQRLNDALAVVQRVRSAPVSPSTKARADALAARVQRQLRPGPLEWIPR